MAVSQSGETLTEPAADAPARRARAARVDFSQPTKFTTELRRRIAAALGSA